MFANTCSAVKPRAQGNGLFTQGLPKMLPRCKMKVCSALHEFTCAGESVSKHNLFSARAGWDPQVSSASLLLVCVIAWDSSCVAKSGKIWWSGCVCDGIDWANGRRARVTL